MTKSDRNKEKLPTTAPKKTWGGQWYSPGSFLVATFVTGGQVRASKAPRFLAAKRCTSYMKRLTFILLLLILPNIGWACTCMTISKRDSKRISKKADYVLLGTAVENVHHNDNIKELLDSEQFGIHVKFKVERVYKGRLETEFIFINQFETGNCIQSFKFREKYIIVGTSINKFENLRPFSEEMYKEDEIFESFQSPPPPPIGGMTINKMKCYNIEMELVDHWNEIVEKEIVVYTNQCSSFQGESTSAKYFKK